MLERLSVPDDIARLSTDTVYYGIGKGAEALAALVLIPVLTRAFSPAQFGLWDVTMTFFLLTTTVASLALEPALAAFYFQTQQDDHRKLIASTSVHFRLVSSIVVAIPLFALAPHVSRIIFDTPEHAAYFRVVAAAIPFFLMVNVFKQLLRIDFAPGKFNVVAVGHAGVYAALGIFLVTTMQMGVTGILLGMLGAAVCFSFVGAFLASRLVSFEFSGRELRSMLAFGLPLLPSLLAYWVIDFSDRYFLTKLSTLEQVGIYSVGARISSIIILFVTSFQMAWAPVALSFQHRPDAKERYSRGLFFFLVAAFTAATAIVVFARPILVVLTQPKYYGAEKVVALLVLATVAFGAFLIINIGLILTKKTSLTSAAIAAGAVINLVLNYLLIPRFEMIGAAVATLVSYSVAVALLYRFAQRHYPIDYGIARIAGLALLAVGVMLIATVVGFERSVLLDLLLGVLLMAAFLFLLKLLFFPRTDKG